MNVNIFVHVFWFGAFKVFSQEKGILVISFKKCILSYYTCN